nr:MAG TPA: hypothetical protein [Caudoviricetes sp.]
MVRYFSYPSYNPQLNLISQCSQITVDFIDTRCNDYTMISR